MQFLSIILAFKNINGILCRMVGVRVPYVLLINAIFVEQLGKRIVKFNIFKTFDSECLLLRKNHKETIRHWDKNLCKEFSL